MVVAIALPDWFSDVEVQKGDRMYSVNLHESRCSCGLANCSHLTTAKNFFIDKVKKDKWAVVSALHKEIRRSDFDRALHYMKWLQMWRPKQKIMDYLRKIVFEETRNTVLYLELENMHDIDRALQLICHSIKKWEGAGREELFDMECRAVTAASKLQCPTEIGNPLRFDTLEGALTHYWNLRLYDGDDISIRRMYLDELKPRLTHSRALEVLEAAERIHNRTDYLIMAVLEIEYKEHPAISDLYTCQQSFRRDYNRRVVDFEPYVFDLHTWSGKARITSNWHSIKPNSVLPSKLDLRFSGSMLGVLWRHKAFSQFGKDYLEKRWEDVRITEQEWDNAKWYDAWWYKTLYFDMESRLV